MNYEVIFLAPNIGYPKGSYAVCDSFGRVVKSFVRKNKAEQYCNILNSED